MDGYLGYGKLALALIYTQISFLGIFFWLCYNMYLATLLMGPVSLSGVLGFFLLNQATKKCEYLLTLSPKYLALRLFVALNYRRQILIPWLKLTPYVGKQFFVFLLINIPFSCYFLGIILFTRPSPFLFLMLLALASGMWFVIFGNHVILASLNNRLVQPNKPLFHIATSNRRSRLPLRVTLNLALHLETFHCCSDRRYGFAYGSMGIISMLSFAKVWLCFKRTSFYYYYY